MSDRVRRRRRSSPLRRFLRAWKWWLPTIVLAGLAGGGIWLALQDANAYTAPRLSGPPLVTGRGENAQIIFVTTHHEIRTTRMDKLLGRDPEPPVLHWDVWSFDARDLRQRWVTRVASVRRGQHDVDRGVIGAEGGAVWLLANRLAIVSASGGRLLGDAPLIEARNRSMRASFPTTPQAFAFDGGLVVTAANGAKFRVDPRGLSVRPLENAARSSDVITPMPLRLSGQPFRQRGVALEFNWFGMVAPGELGDGPSALLPPEPDYAQTRTYQLISARIEEQRDAAGMAQRRLTEMSVLASRTGFVNGGILALETQPGARAPILMASPPRALILHRDTVEADAALAISSAGLERGTVQWRSVLPMRRLMGGLPLNDGIPRNWALLLVGRAQPGTGAQDGADTMARVAMEDGTVLRLDIARLPVSSLRLTPEN